MTVDWTSSLVIAAVGAAVVAVIGAFFTGLVQFLTAWRTVAHKVAAIEGHVNSEATAATGRENTLRAENALLREQITDLKQEKALLAQAATQRTSARAADAPAAAATLTKIEEHTEATAQNTARPEAKGTP